MVEYLKKQALTMFVPRRKLFLSLAILIASVSAYASFETLVVGNIMIIGDSIARGQGPATVTDPKGNVIGTYVEVPWRLALKEQLALHEVKAGFVGSFQGSCGSGSVDDMRHMAECGAQTWQLKGWLENYPAPPGSEPDVVIIASGTNDLGGVTDKNGVTSPTHLPACTPDVAINRMKDLINKTFSRFSKTRVIVCTLIYRVGLMDKIPEYNLRLKKLVAEYQASGRRVELLDFAGTSSLSGLHDGLHPGVDLSRKMGMAAFQSVTGLNAWVP